MHTLLSVADMDLWITPVLMHMHMLCIDGRRKCVNTTCFGEKPGGKGGKLKADAGMDSTPWDSHFC